jgi:hypothetical protein
MLLYGLQNINSKEEVIRDLLQTVATMITDWSDELNSQDISMAFYGLQGMSSDSAEVCAVLSALAIKVRACKHLDSQAIRNTFYGLQEMSSHCTPPNLQNYSVYNIYMFIHYDS